MFAAMQLLSNMRRLINPAAAAAKHGTTLEAPWMSSLDQ
jgi:hypothetical protein